MSDLFINTSDNFLGVDLKAKELGKQVDFVVTQRKLEYLDKMVGLKEHSSVSIRRKVAEGLVKLATKEYLEQIETWQKEEADRKTWLALENLKDHLERKNDNAPEIAEQVFTVGEALYLIKKRVDYREFTIEGEIGEIRAFNNGLMYYFPLKGGEDSFGVRAIEFVVQNLGFALNEGLSVRITGVFKISSKGGRMVFDAKSISLTGEGELKKNLKELEQKLRKEGLFDESRKRKIPTFPKRVMLMASPDSAAIDDYCKVVEQRRSGMEIHLLPIKTQGMNAEKIVLDQLERANEIIEDKGMELFIITRGGGSREDLQVFDSERVVRAMYGLNCPSIAAIGHERDVTLSELVADLRCSTPSQAAEKSSISNNDLLVQADKVVQLAKHHVKDQHNNYAKFSNDMILILSNTISKEIQSIRNSIEGVERLVLSRTNETKQLTSLIYNKLYNYIREDFNAMKNYQSIDNIINQITYKIKEYYSELYSSYELIKANDPKNTLAKGFALIKKDENIITTSKKIKGKVTIMMNDGEVEVQKLG